MRLHKTLNALQLPVFFFFFLFFFFFSASLIRNIGESEAKNYFTDHRTANTVNGFRDSVPVVKIHSFYYAKISTTFYSYPTTKRYKVIVVRLCKQPTSNSFQACLYCIYLLKLYDEYIVLLSNDLIFVAK